MSWSTTSTGCRPGRAGARRLPRDRHGRGPRRGHVRPRPPAGAAALGAGHPGRPAAARAAPAGPRRAGRDPRGRPALHPRRGRRVPQPPMGLALRGDVAALPSAPRAGRPPAARGAVPAGPGRPVAVIAGFPATTASSSTTSPRRCSSGSPTRARLPARDSVLDRLTGPLCDAVTGGPAGRRLGALERENLFLVPLDDQRRWYRYHHLFADVLRARLLDEHPDRCRPAPAGQRVVGSTATGRGGPHALGGGRLRPGGGPDRGRHAGDEPRPAGGGARRWVRALPAELVRAGRCWASGSSARSRRRRLRRRRKRLPTSSARCARTAEPGRSGRRRDVVVDEGCVAPRPVAMYRAALRRPGDSTSPSRHAGGAALAPPADDLIPRGRRRARRSRPGPPVTWRRHAATPRRSRASRAPAARGRPRVHDHGGRHPRTQGRLDDALPTYEQALDRPRRTGPHAGHRRHARRPRRGAARAGRPRRRRRAPRSAAGSVSTRACRRTRTGRGSPWRGCGGPGRPRRGPRAARRGRRVYDGDYSPNVRPVAAVRARLCRRGQRARRREPGPRARAVGRRRADLPARVRARDPRPPAHRPGAGAARPGSCSWSGCSRRRRRRRVGALVELLALQALPARPATTGRRASCWGAPGDRAEPRAGAGLRRARSGARRAAPAAQPRASRWPSTAALAAITAPAPPPAQQLVDPLSERELEVLRLLVTELTARTSPGS